MSASYFRGTRAMKMRTPSLCMPLCCSCVSGTEERVPAYKALLRVSNPGLPGRGGGVVLALVPGYERTHQHLNRRTKVSTSSMVNRVFHGCYRTHSYLRSVRGIRKPSHASAFRTTPLRTGESVAGSRRVPLPTASTGSTAVRLPHPFLLSCCSEACLARACPCMSKSRQNRHLRPAVFSGFPRAMHIQYPCHYFRQCESTRFEGTHSG